MTRILQLERFDLPETSASSDNAVPSEGLAGEETTNDCPPEAASEPPGLPGPAAEDPVAEDPVAAAASAVEQLGRHLETLAANREAVRREIDTRLAERFGLAAAASFPALARRGFAAEVAAATQQVLRAGGPETIELRVALEDREAIVTAIAAQSRTSGSLASLPVAEDPTLSPGEAVVAWSGGGARIDADRLAQIACDAFAMSDTEETPS